LTNWTNSLTTFLVILLDLRFILDLFSDLPAVAAHQPLVQTAIARRSRVPTFPDHQGRDFPRSERRLTTLRQEGSKRVGGQVFRIVLFTARKALVEGEILPLTFCTHVVLILTRFSHLARQDLTLAVSMQ
jgi:hypothetical protein